MIPPIDSTGQPLPTSPEPDDRLAHEVSEVALRAIFPKLEMIQRYDEVLRDFPLFRIYIDLDRSLLGPDCFDIDEPGYAQAMEAGFDYIRDTIGTRFGQREFEKLYWRCTEGVGKFEDLGGYRDSDEEITYGLRESISNEARR